MSRNTGRKTVVRWLKASIVKMVRIHFHTPSFFDQLDASGFVKSDKKVNEEKVEEQLDVFQSAIRDTEYSLWAALLTTNAIVVAVIVVIFPTHVNSGTYGKLLVTGLSVFTILFAFYSSFLLIRNYQHRKKWLTDSLKLNGKLRYEHLVPREGFREVERLSINVLTSIESREKCALVLILVEALLVCAFYILLVTGGNSGAPRL